MVNISNFPIVSKYVHYLYSWSHIVSLRFMSGQQEGHESMHWMWQSSRNLLTFTWWGRAMSSIKMSCFPCFWDGKTTGSSVSLTYRSVFRFPLMKTSSFCSHSQNIPKPLLFLLVLVWFLTHISPCTVLYAFSSLDVCHCCDGESAIVVLETMLDEGEQCHPSRWTASRFFGQDGWFQCFVDVSLSVQVSIDENQFLLLSFTEHPQAITLPSCPCLILHTHQFLYRPVCILFTRRLLSSWWRQC